VAEPRKRRQPDKHGVGVQFSRDQNPHLFRL
jgi:hypothetical protein